MPLAFQAPSAIVDSLYSENRSNAVAKLLNHIQQQETLDANGIFATTLKIKMTLVRSNEKGAEIVKLGNSGPNAVAITLTEEDIRERYPWDYETLTEKLRNRYVDFLANQKYHDIRKPLEHEASICHKRLLNPDNANGPTKRFYSSNIVQKFDEHYNKKLLR